MSLTKQASPLHLAIEPEDDWEVSPASRVTVRVCDAAVREGLHREHRRRLRFWPLARRPGGQVRVRAPRVVLVPPSVDGDYILHGDSGLTEGADGTNISPTELTSPTRRALLVACGRGLLRRRGRAQPLVQARPTEEVATSRDDGLVRLLKANIALEDPASGINGDGDGAVDPWTLAASLLADAGLEASSLIAPGGHS
eukprot:CAMPEP_0180563946 /NCGR_PEP_ID=MMETSP1037_2-20121125/4753_1 /TAXON_ID=632150 /ORGANISM="Azadinium spinosum, Strain 3D9" /LENGTH=197 /DNA_ID=CAMNT_0022580823 /DNA_START=36 /DNA_END=627 /DNA_ORIENTATION=-